MTSETGLIKIKLENNLVEDTDYKAKIVTKFEKLVSDSKRNLCLIQLPKDIVRYTFAIYGNKGFISCGSCKINDQPEKESFTHSFIYHVDELYCIHIQSFFNNDSYDDFVQFINNNNNNIDVKIKKISTPPSETPPVRPPSPVPDLIKARNAAALAKFMGVPASPPPPVCKSVVSFNQKTGRKVYTVASDADNDAADDNNDAAADNDADADNDDAADDAAAADDDDADNDNAGDIDVKDIMKEIDLLRDDIFNTDTKADDDVILDN